MQIDKSDVAKKTAIATAVIGVTVTVPYLGLFIAPYVAPLIKDLAIAGLGGVSSISSNALWGLKDSFKPTHENENLTRLLGRAYSEAIEDILKKAAKE